MHTSNHAVQHLQVCERILHGSGPSKRHHYSIVAPSNQAACVLLNLPEALTLSQPIQAHGGLQSESGLGREGCTLQLALLLRTHLALLLRRYLAHAVPDGDLFLLLHRIEGMLEAMCCKTEKALLICMSSDCELAGHVIADKYPFATETLWVKNLERVRKALESQTQL